ncbi:hypothetical protein D3C78_1528430 [compost metagenome]
MWAKAEAKRRFWFAVDVEFIGVFERILIAVGGGNDTLHHCPFGDRHTANLQILGGLAHLEGGHGLKTHRFIDGLVYKATIIAHPLQHIRILQKQCHQGSEGAGRGFAGSREQ